MNKIILNIPHSSAVGIFDPVIGRWPVYGGFINRAVRRWTDWHTDFLFAPDSMSASRVIPVVFPYSRFVCDVERLENDYLEQFGRGIIYTSFDNIERKELSAEARARLMNLWRQHQSNLTDNLNEGDTIIDCHSFPADMADCDICIGHNDDWSYDAATVEYCAEEFRRSGYNVKINSPYSNSITPSAKVAYKSVMIEVNKRVYLDEHTLSLSFSTAGYMRWSSALTSIYHHILGIEPEPVKYTRRLIIRKKD